MVGRKLELAPIKQYNLVDYSLNAISFVVSPRTVVELIGKEPFVWCCRFCPVCVHYFYLDLFLLIEGTPTIIFCVFTMWLPVLVIGAIN